MGLGHQRQDALKALADGTASQADLARRFNVSQSEWFKSLMADALVARKPLSVCAAYLVP
jgi:hypothetical protein